MIASSRHQFQIAPALSPQSSMGRPAAPSTGRAAASFNDEQRQRLTGTALGLRLVMYRSTLGVAKTGGLRARLGCFTSSSFSNAVGGDDLLPTGRGHDGFRPLLGADRERSNVPVASIQRRRKGGFQAFSQRLPTHSRTSSCYVPTRSNTGGQSLGYRGQNDERHPG